MSLNKPPRTSFIDGLVPVTVEQFLTYDYFVDEEVKANMYNVPDGTKLWRMAFGVYNSPYEKSQHYIFCDMNGAPTEMKVDKNYLLYVTEAEFDAAVQSAETYYVGTDSEEPLEIFFERGLAFDCKRYRYLDSFDVHGKRVASYKLKDDNSEYTQDF